MHLIHVISGRFSLTAVFRHSPPYLILHYKHSDLFELLAQIFNVIAYQTICEFHIGSVVKYIQGTSYIDLQCCRHMPCLRLFLLKQRVIQVFKDRHMLRSGIFKIFLIDLSDASVDDRFLNRPESILISNDKLTQ